MAVDLQEYPQAPRQDYHQAPRQEYPSPRREDRRQEAPRKEEARGGRKEDQFERFVRSMRTGLQAPRSERKASFTPPAFARDKKRTGTKGRDSYWLAGLSFTAKVNALEDDRCPICQSGDHDFYKCSRAQRELKFPDEYFFYPRQ